MKISEIDAHVTSALNELIRGHLSKGEIIYISPEVFHLTSNTIERIQTDPSPAWIVDTDYDNIQRQVIGRLGNIFEGILPGAVLEDGKLILSTWEVLHRISQALEFYCPVSKRKRGR